MKGATEIQYFYGQVKQFEQTKNLHKSFLKVKVFGVSVNLVFNFVFIFKTFTIPNFTFNLNNHFRATQDKEY